MSKAKKLDQWFTKKSVAKKCIQDMVNLGYITEFTNVIEPSAGGGVFIDELKKIVDENYIHAFDLDPKRDDIVQADWLKTDPNISDRPIIIGNPPYGKKAKLAVDFINHSLDIAEVVGFIVPITLSTSWTAQKKVRNDAGLIFERTLPKNSFEFEGKEVNVPSVFQVWRRKHKDIRLSKPQTEHQDLEMRIYNKTKTAKKWLSWDWDIAIKRNSKKGDFILKGEKAADSTHWILIKGTDIEALKAINWSKLNDNKMTAGMGKADVVKAYKQIKGETNDN